MWWPSVSNEILLMSSRICGEKARVPLAAAYHLSVCYFPFAMCVVVYFFPDTWPLWDVVSTCRGWMPVNVRSR
jgi:hypothetical protein